MRANEPKEGREKKERAARRKRARLDAHSPRAVLTARRVGHDQKARPKKRCASTHDGREENLRLSKKRAINTTEDFSPCFIPLLFSFPVQTLLACTSNRNEKKERKPNQLHRPLTTPAVDCKKKKRKSFFFWNGSKQDARHDDFSEATTKNEDRK